MSIDGGMDEGDAVHIYNGILLSHKKSKEKNKIVPSAETWMGLSEGEVSKKENNKCCILTYLGGI